MNNNRLASKVLLVGWDAADWQMITPLLDAGKMPALARLIERGVMGNIATLQPCLSPLLWTSIATGKLPDKHGILGFVEPDGRGGIRLSSSTARKTSAVWNIVAHHGLSASVVGWYASHPAERTNGVCVSNQFDADPTIVDGTWPLADDAVVPEKWRVPIADLRVHPSQIGIGELRGLAPSISEATLQSDAKLAELARCLAHCVSVHSAATAIIENESWDLMAVYYDMLDTAGHVFMPFHPPRMDSVPAHDFELYSEVMVRLYQFHDQMLARLIDLAGDDVTVVLVSDHGFHSDHRRPAYSAGKLSEEALAAQWHRQFGVLVISGPGIQQDQRVYGSTLLDVTPTVLRLLGIPAGRDMDGQVITQAFPDAPLLPPVTSWDELISGSAQSAASPQSESSSSDAAIDRLVALGYLDSSVSEKSTAVETARREADVNLATVYLNTRRAHLALPIIRELSDTEPANPRYSMLLAWALNENRQFRDARDVLNDLRSRGMDNPELDAMLARVLIRLGEPDAAKKLLEAAAERHPFSLLLQLALGETHENAADWAAARSAYERALAIDVDSIQAHHGLAGALLEHRDYEGAVSHCLRALSAAYHFPAAHYRLALALIPLGERERAMESLKIAVQVMPGYIDAHKRLGELYREAGDLVRAMQHERLALGHCESSAPQIMTDG